MLVHIIADYGPAGDLAFAEVVQRIKLHLPDAEPVLTPVPPFATLAAGCQATRKWAPFGDINDSAEGSITLDRRGRRGASTAWKTHVP
jgi:hypothetical protein